MERIFLSHSSTNNAEAVALAAWLEREGWKDEVFLDFDLIRGIAAGERWEKKLNEAANRCEAVLFLISKAWIASEWCRRELNLAHRLNKRIFGVLIEDLPITEVPKDLTGDWQLVRLATGRDHVMLNAVLPITQEEVYVTFSSEGLQRLKHGLEQAGLDPKHFAWPPPHDANRPPYRGLKPLEADDAGIFLGREAPVIELLDKLRGLREAAPPRLLVILGASGAGKSSFLRAGLLPRLKRDARNFLPLPIIRPERGTLYGETGLLHALEEAAQAAKIPTPRADIRAAIEGGAEKLRPLLQSLVNKAMPSAHDSKLKRPTLVLAIDQGEELFLAEGQGEAHALLRLLRDLVKDDSPALIVLFTIRSDAYEPLQLTPELDGVRQNTFSLPPMPRGSYSEVIRGPARRLQGTARALDIEDALVDALLADIDEGGAKDALPLLAFTLERLFLEYGGRGRLTLADYEALGRIKGSIEAAVERAFKEADKDGAIPKDRNARLALLRRGLIPWLAGIDPETGIPRRRVARQSEIPAAARPLIDKLIEQRLLATDISRETREQTIEPVHEALLRQWGLLRGWLTEDTGALASLESVKRAALDWVANGKDAAWLTHATNRLEAAERLLSGRPDLAANLKPTDREYLAECRKSENASRSRKRQVQGVLYLLLVGIIIGLVGWINQAYIREQWREHTVGRPFVQAKVRPLPETVERALKAKDTFTECAPEEGKTHCPEMVVIPAGPFMMGSPQTEKERYPSEDPLHPVTISKPFAVAKFQLTFDEWDTCVTYGACPEGISDNAWGRGKRPVINVSWHDAQRYVTWLSKVTGKRYRLLTEAEYEYATRAGKQTAYPWGDDLGKNNAACLNCGSDWDGKQQTAPVGSFKPNAFGLHDMVGNVFGWVEDCFNKNYTGAPPDGSAWIKGGECKIRMARGASWYNHPRIIRSANRAWFSPDARLSMVGIRVGRTLIEP